MSSICLDGALFVHKISVFDDFGIEFNQLFALANLPISRFLDYLIASENFEEYMTALVEAFNPVAAENVMCTNTLSVSWEGYLFDCDFNQMLNLKGIWTRDPKQKSNQSDLKLKSGKCRAPPRVAVLHQGPKRMGKGLCLGNCSLRWSVCSVFNLGSG